MIERVFSLFCHIFGEVLNLRLIALLSVIILKMYTYIQLKMQFFTQDSSSECDVRKFLK